MTQRFVQLSTEKYGVSGDVSISANKVIIKSFRYICNTVKILKRKISFGLR